MLEESEAAELSGSLCGDPHVSGRKVDMIEPGGVKGHEQYQLPAGAEGRREVRTEGR